MLGRGELEGVAVIAMSVLLNEPLIKPWCLKVP